MAGGVDFRVAPDVRLLLRRRGPRSPFGPGLQRRPTPVTLDELLDLDGSASSWTSGAPRRPADQPDIDEPSVREWQQLSGGGLAASHHGGATDEWIGHEAHLQRLLSAHTVPVIRAQRPVLTPPAPVSRALVREQVRRDATHDIPAWHVRGRMLALRDAEDNVDAQVQVEQAHLDSEHATRQAAADTWWQRLCDAEPIATMDQLNQGFERDVVPAGPTAVEGDTAHVVMAVDTAEMLIGRREPSTRDQRSVSVAIMNESRRNRLYVQALCAGVLQVAAVSFALVPGIRRLEIAVVGVTRPGGPAVLMLAGLPRDVVLPDGIDRPAIAELVASAQQGRIRLVLERSGLDDGPKPLSTRTPGVQAALDAIHVG
ncbi:MAG: hypothetical protein WDZ26_05155 [Nitriliruptoraceae bacterium]